MLGNAMERDGDELRDDGSEPRKSSVWSLLMERLSFGATLAGVAAVAVFIGWLLGQYAIQSVTGPRLTTDPLERPHNTDHLAPAPPYSDSLSATTPTSAAGTPAPPSPTATSGDTTPTSTGTGTRQSPPASTPSAAPSATSTATSGSASSASQSSPPSQAQPAAGSSSTATPSAGGFWRVQAGAFSERGRAESVAAELKASGFEAFVSSTAPYRVQVGAFSDAARARAIVEELHSSGFEAIVVPPN